MRVLFISRHFPKYLSTTAYGVYKRMGMFIDAIKEIASLDMLFYVPPDTDVSPSSVSKLERSFSQLWNADIRLFLCPVSKLNHKGELYRWAYSGAGVFNFFRQMNTRDMSGPKQIQAFEECLSQKPDAIFAHRLFSMCPPLLTRKSLPPIYLDLDDIEHVVFRRMLGRIKQSRQKLLYLHLPTRFCGEYRAIRLANLTFVCSETDRCYMKNRLRLPNVVSVPNAVNIPELQPITEEPTLLFLGSDYTQNIDAAELLLKSIWPSIYKEMPMARLIIAGISPSLILARIFPNSINGNFSHIPGVKLAGFVSDLDGLYKQSRVICVPILAGGGTRVKIIEAAAYGKPIVSTRIGAEGIEMSDGHELLLRDDPLSFAETCLRLFKDTALCNRLGSAARTAAICRYNRANVVPLIKRYLNKELSRISRT